MSLASPALLFAELYTHSSRCGLEEFRQLRWLKIPKPGQEQGDKIKSLLSDFGNYGDFDNPR